MDAGKLRQHVYRGRIHEGGPGAALHDARRILGLAGRVNAQHVATFREVALAEEGPGEEAGAQLSEEGHYHSGGAERKLLGVRSRVVERILDQRGYTKPSLAS